MDRPAQRRPRREAAPPAPIGPYVADFACVERKLVVEVDGGVHRFRTAEDKLRTEALERMGWSVLRLPNELVMADLSGALTLIQDALRP